MRHEMEVRVYYEDTDLGGIVYYANYLKFIERGRTELLRDAGVDQVALKEDTGVVFAVRRIEADYLAPAKMDDVLRIETRVADQGRVRIVMEQGVFRREEQLFSAVVTLACIVESGRPVRVPAPVLAAMA